MVILEEQGEEDTGSAWDIGLGEYAYCKTLIDLVCGGQCHETSQHATLARTGFK